MIPLLSDLTPPVALPDSVPAVHQELSMLRTLSVDELINRIVSSIVTLAVNIAIAIAVFYAGRFIINKLYHLVAGILERRRVDASLSTFVLSLIRIVLFFILIVTVIGILGIETSSFLAIFASAGVAIGMALSGTLQNFAGGVLILLLKPYRIGEYIEAQGYAGTVREIQIFHTVISTPDNKSILIPNGPLSTGSVNNWSREDYRRVDWSVGISYGDDVPTARTAILDILSSDSRIVNTTIDNHRSGCDDISAVTVPPPANAPAVRVAELADSAVVLKVTAWTPTKEYWNVFYEINERIYGELPASGISFPFPQLDVHINKTT